jgi:hypothetical protein
LFEAELEWTIPFPISKFLLFAPPFVYDGPDEEEGLPQAGNRNHTQTNTKADLQQWSSKTREREREREKH